MSTTPLLSIIIPTKNRYNTLFPVVEYLLSIKDIEVIIQDNSDDNIEALQFVNEKREFANLKYFYQKDALSVIENSDKAVLNSTGEYICFIGDDDIVMPYIVDIARWMKNNGTEIIKASKPVYYWPEQKSNYLSKDATGEVRIPDFDYAIRKIDSKMALKYTIEKGGVSIKMLPCLYHGIVARETLNKIYSKNNTFFPGPSPDMANAVALTKVSDGYIYVDYPVVVSGKSIMSTGGAGILHKHIAKIEDVKHLPKETSIEWSIQIPKYWTGPTIWAESVIKVLEKYDDIDALKNFNTEYLYAHLHIFNSKHKKQIFGDFIYRKGIRFYGYFLSIFFDRGVTFLKNRMKLNFKTYSHVDNISDAVKIINANLDENKFLNKKIV